MSDERFICLPLRLGSIYIAPEQITHVEDCGESDRCYIRVAGAHQPVEIRVSAERCVAMLRAYEKAKAKLSFLPPPALS